MPDIAARVQLVAAMPEAIEAETVPLWNTRL